MKMDWDKRKLSKRRISWILSTASVLIFLLITLNLLHSASYLDTETVIYFYSVLLVLLFMWSLWSWKLVTRSLFDPYVLFFISVTLFNAGQVILEVFNLNEGGILKGMFPPGTLLKTLFLVLIGIGLLHSGAMLGALTKRSEHKYPKKYNNGVSSTQAVRWVGWFFLFISLVPAFIIIRDNITVVMEAGYSALFQQKSITSFEAAPRVLATFLVPATLFLLAGSEGRKSLVWVSTIIIINYTLVFFFMGSRAWAAMPLIAYLWLRHRIIRPIRVPVLLSIAIFLLFFIFPIVREVRNLPGEERVSFDFLAKTFSLTENPLIGTISEIGGSMRTIAHTIELVPSVRSFDMGVGYLYSLFTILPNLFWDVHPTVARGLAGDWLTWTVEPVTAFLGGGVGFSCFAEAYLNFGWIGILVIPFLIGYSLSKFVLWAVTSGDPAKLAMIASFLAFILFYARGESAYTVRPLVWYSLLPFFCVYLLRVFLRKNG
jgi:oligosaccharide repeat unit polymerase